MSSQTAPAHKAAWRETLLSLLLSCAVAAAHAQAGTPAGAAAGDGAPSEAARRAAQSPYRFILQHAAPAATARKPVPDKEKVEAARKPAAVEPPVQSAARSAPVATEQAPAAAAVVPPSAAAPTPVAAPPAEPAQVAARSPAAVPPPVRRDIIPVRTDEPRLPAALLRERPNGVVRVQFDVLPDGSASGVKVVSSSNRALNRPTVEAVSGWKFQPVDEVLTVETEIAYKYD